MTDRTWRNFDHSHFKPNVLGGVGLQPARGAGAPMTMPSLPIFAFEVGESLYEVHRVEGRYELTRQIIPEHKAYIGRVVFNCGEYLAFYDRAHQHRYPLTNAFAFEDAGLSAAIGWIVEHSEAQLELGWKRLVAAIENCHCSGMGCKWCEGRVDA
jgi:hypothetical protein